MSNKCSECGGTEFFWHCREGWGLATCLACRVLNWFRQGRSGSMKCGQWKIAGECPDCQIPIETAEWCWDRRTPDSYRTGSDFPCCPHCGKMRPESGWAKATFRRVKDGWLSPWRWQKWQEPVVGGVEVRFTMAQPKEGAGDE